MSVFPTRMKIQSKMKVQECSQLGFFFRRSRAANSAVHGRIRLNFKIIPDFVVVLRTCKNEEKFIKSEGARVSTTFQIDFSDAQGQLTS